MNLLFAVAVAAHAPAKRAALSSGPFCAPSEAYFRFFTVRVPDAVFPFVPVAVPETVEVPLPLFTAVPLPVTVLPFRPVAVPLAVVVPFLLLTLPLAVAPPEVEADALPLYPATVFVAVAVPVALFPRTPVAVPVAVAVLPLVVTVPVAVLPCGPVTVCCAEAPEMPSERTNEVRAMRAIFIKILLGGASGNEAEPRPFVSGYVNPACCAAVSVTDTS
jgi:hypothetical protein